MQADRYPRWFTKLSIKNQALVTPEINPYPRWITWLGLAFSVLLCASSFWEWLMISVLSDQRMINDYRSAYHSPENYAASALHVALCCLPVIILFALAVKKGSHFLRLLACACIIFAIIVTNLLN